MLRKRPPVLGDPSPVLSLYAACWRRYAAHAMAGLGYGTGNRAHPTPYEGGASYGCPASGAGVLEQNYPVAMAYVPWQQWQSPYAPERGLAQGPFSRIWT